MNDRLLTTNEVAERCRIGESTLRVWRASGKGPRSFRVGGRRVLYRESDVQAWLDAAHAAAVA